MTKTADDITVFSDKIHGQIGHNEPPSDIEVFGERARQKYPEVLAFAERIIATEDRLPTSVEDDVSSGKLGDFINQIKTADKSVNGAREEEKAVYLKGSQMVDGYFNRYREKLRALKKKAEDVQAVYLTKKADEKRRADEERAAELKRKADAELAEARRKAAEAEALRVEQAKEAARVAAEAAARQKEIEEKAAAERAAQQKVIDEMKAAAAQQEKIDAETKAKLKEAEEKLKAVNQAEKAELKEVKADLREGEAAVADLGRAAKIQQRESNKLLDEAVRSDKQAEKADKLAGSSDADLARTRGLGGSLSTIRTDWVGTLTDRSTLDLEALRPYFREDDLQFAIDQHVKAHDGKALRGAYVREETRAVVR